MPSEAKIFSGRSNPDLAAEIASYLELPLGKVNIKNFSDGEIFIKFEENIRGADIFIVQSTNPPALNILELLIMLDAAKRASAKRITAVIPYYGYCRQDRKDRPRVPITAKLVADLITVAGANRILTMDLHAPQIQGFFNIPFDHLYSSMVLVEHCRFNFPEKDWVILSPDVGSIKIARAYARRLSADLAIIDKRRPEPNVAEIYNVIGDVKDRDILIIDDMVDTGGTLITAAEAVKKEGANKIYASCTHPVLSGDSVRRIESSSIEKLTVTNTLKIPEEKLFKKLDVVSVAMIFGEAIKRINSEESISALFKEYDYR
ncbi:MAG: ribose-phosphate diphosphokinase [Fidelibacterota bacterium]